MLKVPITELTVGESVINALFLMLFVFILLGALMLLVRLMSAVVIPINNAVQARKQGKTADAAPATVAVSTVTPATTSVAELPQEGLVYTGTLTLRNVDEPTAAMVMAIVSDQSGIPLSQLEFKAIRKLED
ncbi:MAG: OadG family protein [Oscillospiraceae bacterium]